MRDGFFRVAAAVPAVNVADCVRNADNIIMLARELADKGVELAVFPEMSVTGYTCADLFHTSPLLSAAKSQLCRIARETADKPILSVVGMPLAVDGALYNCAVVLQGGSVLAVVPKTYIPCYNEFYEKRWWRSGLGVSTEVDFGEAGRAMVSVSQILVTPSGVKIGMEICEDLWTVVPPSSRASLAGAHVIVNLSASDDVIGKYDYLCGLISQQSARCIGAYVYAGAGFGESSTDLVFDGKAVIAENGTILCRNERWRGGNQYEIADIDIDAINHDRMRIGSFGDCAAVETACNKYAEILTGDTSTGCVAGFYRNISRLPFVPTGDADLDRRAGEIINIQSAGLARRLDFTRCRNAVIGISGGLDSTLALLVTVHAYDRLGLDRTGIVGVTMPGFGTTGRTYNNALTLMRTLGVTVREIPIAPAVNQHFRDIGHDAAVHDVTYENSQARERTQILMDIANQTGGMVIGTGDLSELALGWATYNGDHMSMYGVNAGVPKTLVKYLVRWFAMRAADADEKAALEDVIDTPISPELIPADCNGNITQKTEDLVGPYELHDFFLYHMLRYGRSPRKIYALARHAFSGMYDDATIIHWLRTFFRRFFNQQFKRSCMPDGPKVGSVCLSPRGDWRMPSDATSAIWLAEVDELR